ncbi:MAG: zinc-binding alcohol dehydrogenase family protein [Bacteroidota bacterium]
MKYISCQEPGSFRFAERSAPTPKAGEALLKMTRVGICGTDLHAYQGNQPFFSYPRILGHELAAEIIEVGPNDQTLKAGDQVAIMPYLNCGHCIACRHGKTNCCSTLKVLGVHIDGGMQEIISLPTDILIPANHLSPEQIAIIEPLSIGAHAVRRAQIQKGETVVVMGCGPIGIGIMQLAKLEGAQVIALDINPQRLAYAEKTLGLQHLINVQNDPIEQIKAITQGDMATKVFDATGNQASLLSGPDYLAHGGSYILVGLLKGDLTYYHPAIHAKETSILCSRNATMEDFARVIEVLSKNQFPVDQYITHRVGFGQMIEHFESWIDPKSQVMKAMVSFG